MPITSSFNGASARALGFTSSGYTAIGNGYWISKTYKNNVNIAPNSGNGVISDSSNNVYYTGYALDYPSGTDYSQNVVKYDSNGAITWQRKLDTASINDVGYTITVDSSGNVYALGVGNANTYGTYVKYNSSGTLQYQKRLADAYIYVVPHDSTTDSSGNLYIAGQTFNNLTNQVDAVLLKLDSSGAITWQRRVYSAGSNSDGFWSLAVDSSGNVYACGFSVFATSRRKGLIFKYNSSGTLQWQRELNSSYDIFPSTIALDSTGNVYVGSFYVDTAGGTIFGSLVKYNSSGTLQWQNKITYSAFGLTLPCYTRSLAIDSSDNIYVTYPSGSYYSVSGTVVGSPMLVQKVDSSGTEQWRRNLNINNESNSGNVSISINGSNMYIGTGVSFTGASSVFIAKLPTDGSKTGNYTVAGLNVSYSPEISTTITSGSLVDTSGSMTDTAGSLTSSTATLTDSANNLTTAVRD